MIPYQIRNLKNYPPFAGHLEIIFDIPYSIIKGEDPYCYRDENGIEQNTDVNLWVCCINIGWNSTIRNEGRVPETSLKNTNFTIRQFETHEEAIAYCLAHYQKWVKEKYTYVLGLVNVESPHLMVDYTKFPEPVVTHWPEIGSKIVKNDFNPLGESIINENEQKECRFVPAKTLNEAKAELKSKMNEGTKCPCCDQLVKIYKRKLNAGMAYGLIHLLKIQQDKNDFVHVPVEFTKRLINMGDTEFSKLKYWGLVEEQPNDTDPEKKRSGYWRITEKGRLFAENKILVPKYIYIYNTEMFTGDDTTQINILSSLGDKFNYQELMLAI